MNNYSSVHYTKQYKTSTTQGINKVIFKNQKLTAFLAFHRIMHFRDIYLTYPVQIRGRDTIEEPHVLPCGNSKERGIVSDLVGSHC